MVPELSAIDFPGERRIEFYLEDALGNLQTIQGQIAHAVLYRIESVLYKLDKSLPFTQNDFVVLANQGSIQSIRGLYQGPCDIEFVEISENFFKNAMRKFILPNPSQRVRHLSAAALELGHLYLNQRKFSDAIDSFERVVSAYQIVQDGTCRNPRIRYRNAMTRAYAESSFYIGLIQWQQSNYELALVRPAAACGRSQVNQCL